MESLAFTHLHVHTEYSLLDGAAKMQDIVQKAASLGMKNLAITDHGVMYGVVDFYNSCKSNQIKPILGCEAYVAARSMHEKVGRADRENAHLILLAKNNTGYQNLMKLCSLGFTEGFYYKPRIDYDTLQNYSEGLIGLSACLAGDIPQCLLSGRYDSALELAKRLQGIFGAGNFYLELQDHALPEQKQVNPLLVRLSRETGIPLIATNDVHYVNKEDAEAQDVLMCIQTNKYLSDKERMRFETQEFYLKSEEEMTGIFGNIPEALQNTELVAGQCNVELDFGKLHLPEFIAPAGQKNEEFLRQLCFEGLKKKIPGTNDSYVLRLEYELDVISHMNYVDYFLIVWDFIKYAKDNGIAVGPGRGSAAGSLAAYCLDITDIDPIKYQLLFERFLNPERISMPDIDIDFCFERRQEVIDYVVGKYGADRVAQIITFGTMAARAAVRDVGRVLEIPYGDVDKIAKMIPMELKMTLDKALKISPQFRESYESRTEVKRLVDVAIKLEGMPRHASTHAAGVVISRLPITEYVPLQKNDEAVTTQFSMGILEQLGLLKMDFLGLRTLTVIQDTIKLVKEKHNVTVDFGNMEMDDPNIYAMLGEGDTDGVFQLESEGMRHFMKELQPSTFEDIIAGISLYRPGPMDSIPRYVQGKRDNKSVVYKDKKLKPILEVTYGCLVYQEQVMQVVRDLAGYSLGRSDLVRRAMSKKKHDVMEKERNIFLYGSPDKTVPGAIANGVSREAANSIFDEMMDFAQYAFNKSHAAAYGVVAYRTAWLKYYYPVEFIAALMNSFLGRPEKIASYIAYCRKKGIQVLPPDVNHSGVSFTVENGAIRFALLGIKNVGQNPVQAILKERDKGLYESFHDFVERVDLSLLNKRMVESMIKSGCFDSMGCRRSALSAIYDRIIDSVAAEKKRIIEGQISLFQMAGVKDHMPEVELPDLPEFKRRELLAAEKEMTGVYISGHPLEDYMQQMNGFTVDSLAVSEMNQAQDNMRVEVGGIITQKRVKATKNNNLMAYCTLEDQVGTINLVVFPAVLTRYAQLLELDSVVGVFGHVNIKEEEAPVILADEIYDLSHAKRNDWKQKREQAKKLHVRLEDMEPLKSGTLVALLNKHTGSTKVVVHIGEKKLSADNTVDLQDSLQEELKKCYGSQNIWCE
ncbi:MAG: DNA polymerase III subunit alpha [Christensenellales bacterium]